MISMLDLTYVQLYIWRRGEEERKNSTASIEAPLAEELVNKSSTVHVLELGYNQGGKAKTFKARQGFQILARAWGS